MLVVMDFYLFLVTVAATIFTLLGTKIFYMVYGKFKGQENKIIASSSSSSSSPSSSLSLPSPPSSLPRHWIHDVFPSFHGADVRRSFLSHIMKEFRSKGINPFIDNKIERGEFIGPELKTAIQGSKIAIVLLSKNYASSSWCLDELVEIMKCKKDLGQTVIAIFYEVDPSDIKKQAGDFGKVFKKTCNGKTNDVIAKWKEALAQVATVAGYHSINWEDEAIMIENIAIDISNMLNISIPSRDFDELVGMEAHMERMDLLLRLDLDEVRMIGIWGPPGIGKSTIARVLFNQFSNCFQLRAIMVNIKVNYPRLCLDEGNAQLQLQKEMLSQMLNQKDMVIIHLGVARERLKDKKVLLVLDDVDSLAQLDALAKDIRWFGHGSRIIVTTQDRKLLKAHKIKHIYKVPFPSTNEALQIFCKYAFRQKYPEDGFEELAREVASLVGVLPLGLEVMGSYLRAMSKDEWLMELPRLRTTLNRKIENVLKYSYDALDKEDQYLFLHIACLFNKDQIERVVEYLANSFHSNVRQGLKVLADKSLISIEYNIFPTPIRMHSLLVQLGEKIVREQSLSEPGQRQFLIDNGKFSEILVDVAAGSGSIIGIKSDSRISRNEEIYDDDVVSLSERAFEGMSNLQFFRVYGPTTFHLPHGLSYLSPKLRLLHWENCPMTCLPSNDNMKFLVELNMPNSKLEKLWERNQHFPNVKRIYLSGSKNLKELPDLSTATSLQKLNLSGCSSLMKLPSSIGNATNLQKLNLSQCSSLMELPSSIGNATNLQELNLSQCSSLVELPSSIGNATNLQELNLSQCSSLVELPPSIGNATNLQELNLSQCSSLVELPPSIGNATNLQELNLSQCSSLVELPPSIGNATNLQELNLSHCSSLVELPPSIGNATNLQELNLSQCSSLVELPPSIGNATNLQELNLSQCSSLVELPSSIGNATNLRILVLSQCSNLVELPSSIGNATNLQELNLSQCSSLVELPSFIGNLHKLRFMNLNGCSKLEVLPVNANLKSLDWLDLGGCSSLKSFPEISTNITRLDLSGTAIEEIGPWSSSIRTWSSLDSLCMSYSEKLQEFPYALETITDLYVTDTEIEEIGPWVKEIPRLRNVILVGCKKLISFPQLPNSLSILDAENCESLERLDCSFQNPVFRLNFVNCFKLNQEARDLIIQGSTGLEVSVLPGKEIPTYFTYRANGGSLIVKLKERPFPSSLKFKACILLTKKNDVEAHDAENDTFRCWIEIKQDSSIRVVRSIPCLLTEHLYIFEFEADVPSKELSFDLEISNYSINTDEWMIKECGCIPEKEFTKEEE